MADVHKHSHLGGLAGLLLEAEKEGGREEGRDQPERSVSEEKIKPKKASPPRS
jgi:hypothetical protein